MNSKPSTKAAKPAWVKLGLAEKIIPSKPCLPLLQNILRHRATTGYSLSLDTITHNGTCNFSIPISIFLQQKAFSTKVFAEEFKLDNSDLGHLQPGKKDCQQDKVCTTLIQGTLKHIRLCQCSVNATIKDLIGFLSEYVILTSCVYYSGNYK